MQVLAQGTQSETIQCPSSIANSITVPLGAFWHPDTYMTRAPATMLPSQCRRQQAALTPHLPHPSRRLPLLARPERELWPVPGGRGLRPILGLFDSWGPGEPSRPSGCQGSSAAERRCLALRGIHLPALLSRPVLSPGNQAATGELFKHPAVSSPRVLSRVYTFPRILVAKT
jgi:hypothetical protein